MTIHKEGYRPIAIGVLIIAAMLVLFEWLFPGTRLWHLPVYATMLLAVLWLFWFFRIPARALCVDPGLIISPADGKVVIIEEVGLPDLADHPMKQVSIFMSPLNVHLNRYPANGQIISVTHYPGKYLVAWHPKSSELNERTQVVMRLENNQLIKVCQVAGFLARRIVCYATEGASASQGGELGFIKFGSRVDLFLPHDFDIRVKVGDKVQGGVSVIASAVVPS